MERIERDIRRELGRFGPSGTIARLVEVWPDAVGDAVARNAWPARVTRDGTLLVNTSSSAWSFELAQLAPTLLDRLRETAEDAAPRALRFAPGPLPEADPAEPDDAAATRPDPSPETVAEAERLAAEIGDEELRKLVARAAAASLGGPPGDRGF
jgi:Dna[CI] antecedent, DciA